MKSLATKVQRFLVSEDGPTAVEYAVMLALIVIVCLTAIRSIGTNANATFESVANELGGLYRGRERDVVFAPLDELPENVNDFRQLDLGEHTLAIRARLPGSNVIMETPAVTIQLDCGPKAKPPLAENVYEGEASGCAVASPLGSSQRRMGVTALFGLLLLAARRRRR